MLADLMQMDINKALRLAHLEGVRLREANPAEFDDNSDNWLISIAHQEYVDDQKLFGVLHDVNTCLAEQAKWGKIDRRAETSFLAI